MNLEELDKTISFIYNKFTLINNQWKRQKNYDELNMKKNKVKDILTNNKISSIIYNYHSYLFSLYNEFLAESEHLTLNNNLELRLKNYNSLQDKVNRYCLYEKHEYGEIPINKCINDILGFRLIFNQEVDFKMIRKYIHNKYKDLVCIDSSKDGYIATHIYFTKFDNYNFRWELQLWNKKDEKNNKECHEKYKQEYTTYETEIEEDEVYG